jgi:general secretion pathway protein M
MKIMRHSAFGRFAATLLAAAVPCVLWLMIGSPLVQRYQQGQSDLQSALESKQRLAMFLEEHRTAAPDQFNLESYRDDFLIGTTDPLALAELQKRVGQLVVANSSELLSVQQLPPGVTSGQITIGLRVQIRATLGKAQQILHLVETERPLLFIVRAVLRSEASTGVVEQSGGIAAVKLVIELDIVGVRWPAGATPKTGPPT